MVGFSDRVQPLAEYKQINEDVSAAAVTNVAAHTWYLSQELVGLAFFDGNLPCSMKCQMVQSLKRIGDEEPPKRESINQQTITNSNLNNFVTSTSKVLLQKLQLPSGFLQKDPDTWSDDNDFLRAASIVPELKVVTTMLKEVWFLCKSTVG